MNRIFICVLLITAFTLSSLENVFAKSPLLYVVTRSTKVFRIGSLTNPTVGLFSTVDNGKSWQHYGWPYSKTFSASIVNVGRKQHMYLSCGNGVLKSEDSGKTWRISSDETMTECLKTAIDSQNPQIVYSATAYGIFKTVDGGKTWQEKNHGLVSTFTPTAIIDHVNNQRLYCATESGIHRSDDAGDHWEPIALLGLGIRTLIQHPKNADLMAVGTEDDGIFISHDHGKTWKQANNGLTHKTVYALAFAPQDENIIYAGTFHGGIFKSTDGGDSWNTANTNLNILDIHALVVDPRDKNMVYAGTINDGVWMSTNGGDNWKFIGLETSQVWDMFIQ